MKALGLKSYRFSAAWPRIYPDGGSRLNPAGLDFYSSLVDALLEADIAPCLTLYHWDLPQALQDKGGWNNRDTASHFSDYAVTMFERFSDRVDMWITHNEPWVAAFIGHQTGVHAPGIRSWKTALQASHHLLLSHAKAVNAFRELGIGGKIGITLNLAPAYPAADSEADHEAAQLADGYQNRWFLDPVFRGSYPEDMTEIYEKRHGAPQMEDGDSALFQDTSVDFLGVNYYTRLLVKGAQKDELFAKAEPADADYTDMGWEIYPEGLYVLLKRLRADYAPKEIYVTENGAAFPDVLIPDNRIDDPDRIRYLQEHFLQAHRAIHEGVPLRGYFVWTLLDNFEWAFGYTKRFGLVYTDFPTQRRIWKQSAYWYQKVIDANGV
jgi:beta-glucosidase